MGRLALFLLFCTSLAACSPKPSVTEKDNQTPASESVVDEAVIESRMDGLESKEALISHSSEVELVMHQQNSESKKVGWSVEQASLLSGHLEVNAKREQNGSVAVVLTVHNPQSHGVYLKFRSGMSADLTLLDGDKPVWSWSNDMMFTQAINYKTLDAGGSTKYDFAIPNLVLKTLKQKEYTLRADFKGVATEVKLPTINAIYGVLKLQP